MDLGASALIFKLYKQMDAMSDEKAENGKTNDEQAKGDTIDYEISVQLLTTATT